MDCPAFASVIAPDEAAADILRDEMRQRRAIALESITPSEIYTVQTRLAELPRFCRYQIMDHRELVLDYRHEYSHNFPSYNRRFVLPMSQKKVSILNRLRGRGGFHLSAFDQRRRREGLWAEYEAIRREEGSSDRDRGKTVILHRFLDVCNCRSRSPVRAAAYSQ